MYNLLKYSITLTKGLTQAALFNTKRPKHLRGRDLIS